MSRLDDMRRAGKDDNPPAPSKLDPAELARIERTSAENHQRLALLLWKGADEFGKVVAAVEKMGNEGYQAITDEEVAADFVAINGPSMIRALRTLAMRLDRSVMVKATESN